MDHEGFVFPEFRGQRDQIQASKLIACGKLTYDDGSVVRRVAPTAAPKQALTDEVLRKATEAQIASFGQTPRQLFTVPVKTIVSKLLILPTAKPSVFFYPANRKIAKPWDLNPANRKTRDAQPRSSMPCPCKMSEPRILILEPSTLPNPAFAQDPDLIAATVHDEYSVGPSIRPSCTRCCFIMTNMIQV